MEKSTAIARLKRLAAAHLSPVDLARTCHVARVVNALPGRRVLNIGCGFGALELVLDEHKQTIGIDIDAARLRVAREYNAGRSNAQFRQVDLFQMSRSDEKELGPAEIVVLSEVLEHLPNETGALQAVRAALTTDGYLVITVPNIFRFKDRFYRRTPGDHTRMDPGHVREYTREQLLQSLQANGFVVLRLAGICVRLPGDRLLRRAVPHQSRGRDWIVKHRPDWANYFLAVARPAPLPAPAATPRLPTPQPERAAGISLVTHLTSRRRRDPLSRFASSAIWRTIRGLGLTEQFVRAYYAPNAGRRRWQGRAACLLLSFDLDHEADVRAVPRVLDVLKPYGWPVSGACVGLLMEAWPHEHERLLQHGHELMSHTYHHPPNPAVYGGRTYPQLSPAELRDEITRCHETCLKHFGYAMQGFRAPHFGDQQNRQAHACLATLGYRYSSSLIATHTPWSRHGLPYLQDGVLEIPISPSPLGPSATLETYTVLRSARRLTPAQFTAAFELLLRVGIETNSLINVYLDPRDLAENPTLFRATLELIRHYETELWIPRYRELTDFWLRQGDVSLPGDP